MDDLVKKIVLFIFLVLGMVGFSPTSHSANPSKKNYLMKLKKYFRDINAKQAFAKYRFKNYRVIKEINLYVMEDLTETELNLLKAKFKDHMVYLEEDYPVKAFTSPNDPQFSAQSGLKRMFMQDAWDISTGSQEVIVAVSDSGVDIDHPDLANQIWTNAGEIPGNGIDDDNNGYIDDVSGWNFFNNSNNPRDDNGHGTHVAGIIGAKGDNGVGITGVNWNVRIMPVKFLNANGSGTTSGGVESIRYAANHGAKVINLSWGGVDESNALRDIILYANSKGALVVAAAGNDRQDNEWHQQYPANFDISGLISVASSQSNGVLSSFSNLGNFLVDLAAPGSEILSTVPNSYTRYSGTSMASPMVAGVAALMLSVEPQLSVIELKNGLFNATDYYDAYNKKLSTRGELNAFRALDQLVSNEFMIWPKKIAIKTATSYQLSAIRNVGSVTWEVVSGSGGSVSSKGVVSASSSGGILNIKATDESGDVATMTVEFIKPTPQPDTGGGCTKSAVANDGGPSSSSGLMNLIGYILMIGFYLLTRRRKFKIV